MVLLVVVMLVRVVVAVAAAVVGHVGNEGGGGLEAPGEVVRCPPPRHGPLTLTLTLGGERVEAEEP